MSSQTTQNPAPSSTNQNKTDTKEPIKDTDNSDKERIKVSIPKGFDLNSDEATGPGFEFEKPQAPDILETLNPVLFRSTNQVQKPEAIISIEGNTVSTAGNLTTIAGQAKAGKSGCISGLLAGAIALPGDVPPDTVGLTVKPNKEGKALIHVDAEQSTYDHHRSMLQVLKRASRTTEPDYFYSFNFQLFSVQQRRQFLNEVCSILADRHNGIHLIVLDGGADFVNDTNDLKESNEVVQQFTSLAITYNCPLISVLHFNPGISEKGRVHFGSQLERKSESVIAIIKDKDTEVSTIEGKQLRNSGILPAVQFSYDVDLGYHAFYGIRKTVSKEEARADQLQDLAAKLFPTGTEQYTYTELWKAIMPLETCKDRTAKTRVKYLLDAEIIKESEITGKHTLNNPDIVQKVQK